MSVNPASFPRGLDLPKQSPLFWVSQKDRLLRQLLISDLETMTGRRLIVYYTDISSGAQIDWDDEKFFVELLKDVGDAPFDLLLETGGGYTDATENLVSILLNHKHPFRAIIASRSKSNGTTIALASEGIYMGPNSELGPIDPQLAGTPSQTIVKIYQDQKANPNLFNTTPIEHVVPPVLNDLAEKAIAQTKQLASDALNRGMKIADKAARDTIVDTLISRDAFPSHGAVIDFNEALAIGLNIIPLDAADPLWEKFWLLWCMYDFDCNRSTLSKVYESHNISHSILKQ